MVKKMHKMVLGDRRLKVRYRLSRPGLMKVRFFSRFRNAISYGFHIYPSTRLIKFINDAVNRLRQMINILPEVIDV
ncbi:hypothetical protein ALC56_03621 [Trachymyrmex septentrionalis]|uniref:Uncharacterized protein n=1 Tax=Trachymyrmex septentrionalis TaxID=34720 RepID=A0A151JZC7_9HYME|nr:hypothetical protein ALC56_03621 [Trachymyrmex septentrionalis]